MKTFFVFLCLGAVAASSCGRSPQGLTEQEKDDLVVLGMCGFWQATIDDEDASDEERHAAEDSWRENDCESRLEGLSLGSSSTTQGVILSGTVEDMEAAKEKTEAGAIAYVSSPANVLEFSERFGGLFDGPVQGLEARLVGDCAGVRFDSDLLREMAEQLNDEYEPWIVFIRWTGAGWEPAVLIGSAEVWSYPDADFDFCAEP